MCASLHNTADDLQDAKDRLSAPTASPAERVILQEGIRISIDDAISSASEEVLLHPAYSFVTSEHLGSSIASKNKYSIVSRNTLG